MDLDPATFLVQWAVGGMAGCWFTTRQREVGAGYGWLLRIIFGLFAVAATGIGFRSDATGSAVALRNGASAVVAVSILVALAVSVRRRKRLIGPGSFDPRLDLVPVVVGLVALVAAGVEAGGPDGLAIARTVVGAAFLGFVSDAMLLGHWYLVQPGLPRRHVREIVMAFGRIWPLEVLVFL
ncbi:MAG: hypothetical protein ACKOA6_01635, partial [Actinomycetota bacterium]